MKCQEQQENIDELEHENVERMLQENRDLTCVVDDMGKIETFTVQTVFEINE